VNREQGEAIVFVDSISRGYLFEQNADGHWHKSGQLQFDFSCNYGREAVENGDIGLESHAWPDLIIGGRRAEIYSGPRGCGSP
jgi:hypothetical protein